MRSLIAEINGAIALTLLVVAILFAGGFFPYQHQQRERLIADHLFLLKTFKKSEERALIDDIFEGKSDALLLELNRLGQTKGVEAIAVYDLNGHRLADYPPGSFSGDLSPPHLEALTKSDGESQVGEWQGREALWYLAPFRVVDETIGYMQIAYSLEDLVKYQRASQFFFLLLLLSLLLVTVALLNLRLSRLVTSPLKRLVKTLRDVEGGNLSARAAIDRHNEIGQLGKAFNEMVTQLQASFDEIQKQNVELKTLDRLKNEFLANVSHEIRTPLHAIIGFSEGMVDESDINAEHKKYLQMILESSRSLNVLVGQLLDFSRIKAGKLQLQRESFSIEKVAALVLPLAQKLVGEKPVTVMNRIPKNLPLVWGEQGRVQQILLNLLENAVKFTERGEVSLTASEKGTMLELIVRDTGIGIAGKKIPVIFDEFRQGDGSTRRKYGGTGLGLAIVKQLVALHGGEIWVESKEGKGSAFHFTLPKA